jgi:hypothetical protein
VVEEEAVEAEKKLFLMIHLITSIDLVDQTLVKNQADLIET